MNYWQFIRAAALTQTNSWTFFSSPDVHISPWIGDCGEKNASGVDWQGRNWGELNPVPRDPFRSVHSLCHGAFEARAMRACPNDQNSSQSRPFHRRKIGLINCDGRFLCTIKGRLSEASSTSLYAILSRHRYKTERNERRAQNRSQATFPTLTRTVRARSTLARGTMQWWYTIIG